MSVTLKDVAKYVGVHPSIVSRVINQDNTLKIKPKTRYAIQQAIKDLNYQPNVTARNLQKGKNQTVGLVIPNFDNPVYAQIIDGAEKQAIEDGYNLIIYTAQPQNEKPMYIQHINQGSLDGLLIASTEFNDKHLGYLANKSVPFVLVNRLADGYENYVTINDNGAAQMAVEYLISNGHQEIAHLSGPLFTGTGLHRFKGYRTALNHAGLSFHTDFVHEGEYSIQSGYQNMKKLTRLDKKPTAIFAANVMIALGAMQATHEEYYSIPEDFSLIAMHDVYFCSALHPPLTTIKLPLKEMGKEAVKKLIAKFDNSHQALAGTVLEAKELVVRKSVMKI